MSEPLTSGGRWSGDGDCSFEELANTMAWLTRINPEWVLTPEELFGTGFDRYHPAPRDVV